MKFASKVCCFWLLFLLSATFLALIYVLTSRPEGNNNEYDGIRVIGPRQWAINYNVAHFSPRIIIHNHNNKNDDQTGRVSFEALGFYDSLDQSYREIADRVKFLIRFANGNRVRLDVTDVYRIKIGIKLVGVPRFLFKFKSELRTTNVNSLIDRTVFLLVDGINTTDELLTFQRPFIYYDQSSRTKKQALAHCVHNLRHLDVDERMWELQNWLTIQQRLGFDAIKLYLLNVTDHDRKRLRQMADAQKKWNMSVELIEYKKPVFEETCHPQIEFFRRHQSWRWARKQAVRCKDFFFAYMGDHWKGFHTRELVATNDCFASFKYTHELVTNYDFDEFILPRKLAPTRDLARILSDITSTSRQHNPIDIDSYNLYEYLVGLIKANTSSKIGWLSFEHMLFFSNLPANFLPNLKHLVEWTNQMKNEINATTMFKFEYEDKKEANFEFKVERDVRFARSVLDSREAIEMLNQSLAHDKLAVKFDRVDGIWCNQRLGKAVFVTDYVEFVSQHRAEMMNEREAVELKVPVDVGFVNHYREPINPQSLKFDYAFSQHYRVDLEAYWFLARLFPRVSNKISKFIKY